MMLASPAKLENGIFQVLRISPHTMQGSTKQVLVAEANAGEAGLFCGFQTGAGLGGGGGWRVVHQELRSEGEKGVRYIAIYSSDKGGQPVHLILVNVTRYKRGAGYQPRWRRALQRPLGGPGEIVQYF